MAQDSLVSPAQPMGGEQSSTDPKLWPEHQRLFFSCRECYCNSSLVLNAPLLCLLFRASLLRTYGVHTYSILLISPNLHLYLLWQPSRQSCHFAISPSLSVSPPQSTPLTLFSYSSHLHSLHSLSPDPAFAHVETPAFFQIGFHRAFRSSPSTFFFLSSQLVWPVQKEVSAV